MELTREQVIQKHRELWNWLADEAEKRGRVVSKHNYFVSHPEIEDIPFNYCWCCEWVAKLHNISPQNFFLKSHCKDCPLDWGDFECCDDIDSLYDIWSRAYQLGDTDTYINIARKIANLPEKMVEGDDQNEK